MAKLKRSTFFAAGLGALLACVAVAPASAATYTINTTADPVGAGCVGGTCSLRQAIAVVNGGLGGGDTINLPAGHYFLSLGTALTATKPVTIAGAGARSTIIDANATSIVLGFYVGSSPSAVTGLTVTGGSAAGPGGIDNDVALTISDTAITGNRATGSTGGGVLNHATGVLAIDRSTVSGNTAFTIGGGIYNQGTLTMTNSTVSGNTADPNNAGWEAGGLYTSGTATITNSTIAGNTAHHGAGVDAGAGTASFKNTVVAANTATGPGNANCAGSTFASLGHNLEDADTCNFNQASDLRSTPAGLGALQDNGGPTDTRALLAGSAAIEGADNSGCPATDQRGVSRPQSGVCDIGAYEFAPPTVTTGSASDVSFAGASVAGTVQPNLRAATYYFEYGKTAAYGSASAAQSAGSGNSSVAVNATFTELLAGTTYHYRLVATNADGTTTGSDLTFTTLTFSDTFSGATLASRRLKVDRKGRVKLRVSCPASTVGGSCLTVGALYTTKGKLPASVSQAGTQARARKATRLGRASFSVTAGKTQVKRVRLNKAGRRLARRHRTLRARVLLTSRDGSGNTKTRRYSVKVKRA